jgi:hypothetical protein
MGASIGPARAPHRGTASRPRAVTISAAFRILDNTAVSVAHGPLCLALSVYRQKILLKYTLIRTGELKSASNPRRH